MYIFPGGKRNADEKMHDLDYKENTSERPVDALAVKTSLTDSVTDNLKSRDASASKKPTA